MKHRDKKILQSLVMHAFIVICCIVALIPILYAFSVSFNSGNSLVESDFSFIPRNFTLDNYKAVLTDEPLLLWLKNSVILATATLIISLSVAIPAAYAFSRYKFRGRKTILQVLILLNAFPAILSMFAIYRLLSPLGLINTKTGLVLVYIGTMAIFGLWNLKGYFDTVPIGIEEAARIDGASDYVIAKSIMIPLAKPSIIVTAVMILIYVWNEYIYAITFMTGASNYTLAAGLYSLQATETTGNWPIFAAASLLVSLPVLVMFLLAQRHMVSGLTVGGMKG